jgi:peptidyl-prolyl cis-trans isomerase D
MFSTIRDNKRLVQGFLVLITIPFALWGVETYIRNSTIGDDVATVAGAKISQQELRAALNEQQERLRAQAEGQFDPAMFETPQVRRMVLETLITKRLLASQGRDGRLAVSDQELARHIASIPAFQENGQFSKSRYESVLSAQGMRQEMFEARLRQDMLTQQLIFPVVAGSLPGRATADHWVKTQLEQREVAEARLMAEDYLARVSLPPDAARKYYDANRGKFESPEQARAEFVVLSRDTLAGQVTVSDAEIKAAYDARIDRYKEGERRRASHILIAVAKDATEADVKKARAVAEEVRAKLKQAPGDFAKLAKQYSQDPGSAQQGGDLGWFTRGAMVKPFEDAAFQLSEGQTSGIVRSDFGFHIIQVTGAQAERVKPFAEVRDELANQLKQEAAAKKYAEAAEAFGNMVYEQGDSLAPVAEKWKLAVQRTAWLPRGAKLPPPFDNAKLAAALFSDDVLKAKHNTEAIEVSPGVLVSARAVEYQPAAVQDFAVVKAGIEKYLTQAKAARLAVKDGEEKLARLRKGEAVDVKWSTPRPVNRMLTRDIPPDNLRAIFGIKSGHLPGYAGGGLPDGYVIYRLDSIKSLDGDGQQEAMTRAMGERYRQVIAEEEAVAWLTTLKDKFPVKVNEAALEKR